MPLAARLKVHGVSEDGHYHLSGSVQANAARLGNTPTMTAEMPSRWSGRDDLKRGDAYDANWAAMKQAGESLHGEADFISSLGPSSVLDAGCGTGRVAIELARRGVDVVGVDLDEEMLSTARRNEPDLVWVLASVAEVDLSRVFDVVVMAGNVMIFVAPGSEAEVVANMARHIRPDGLLVAGFALRPNELTLAGYDQACDHARLKLVDRFATWGGDAYDGGPYAVSVHQPAGQ